MTLEESDERKRYWDQKLRELYAMRGDPPPVEPTPEELEQENREWAALQVLNDEALTTRWANRELTDEDRERVRQAQPPK